MANALTTPDDAPQEAPAGILNWHRAYLGFVSRKLFAFTDAVHGISAFALITLVVLFKKNRHARRVIHPLIRGQIERAGLRLLPMTSYLAAALGLVIIGQAVFLLDQIGVQNFTGTIMVTVVVRELGPMIAALVVLARVGTAIVIELGTSRALGEVEAMEALGIDPVHFFVVPRVIGLALSIFALTIYLIIIALLSGYLFAFLQDVPLYPSEYFKQITAALTWQDFVLLALKTSLFGAIIALVTCYQGLAQPLRIEEVATATTRAVGRSVVACVLLDALFIIVYLVM